MDYKEIVTRILTEYNSITKSRTRWVRNRKDLKNNWKELFEVLETASGRDGRKLAVFDKEWHKVADKGGVRGAMNKGVDEVETLQPAKAEPTTEKAEAKAEEPKKKAPAKKTAAKK